MVVKYNKAYKYSLKPTESQETFFQKSFGCCRKIWNLMLSDKIDFYKSDGLVLPLTPAMYKADPRYNYLKEVDSLALTNVQLNLEKAYKAFFERPEVGFPKFKAKHKCRKSYTTNCQKPKGSKEPTITIGKNFIKLPKIGKVKAAIYRKASEHYILKSVTVSQDSDGKYYASVLYEYTAELEPSIIDFDNVIGLDYKSDGLFVDSFGNCPAMPHWYRKMQECLAKEQRKLSRMREADIACYITDKDGKCCPVYTKPLDECKNYQKQKLKVAKLHKRIANQRMDFLQKLSTKIANSYDIVCVEDLNMKTMANKGFGNGKATMDNGYGMFLKMLEYKLKERGKYFIKVDKWYPSSQLCNCCRYQNSVVKDLRIRDWTCPICGTHHDRDMNAAINIRNEGVRILMARLELSEQAIAA